MKFLTILLISGLFITTDIFAQQTLYGDTVQLGNGNIYTWVNYNTQGIRDLIGITLTEGVLNNLGSEYEHSLLLPRLETDTLFNHVFFLWSPYGHGPSYWTLPHFDMHFMMVSVAEREAVVAGIDSVLPQQYIPSDYIPLPGIIPKMGAHWVDSTSPELHGQTFTYNTLYGFYRYKMFFIEPMITRAYLLTNPHDTLNIKQPAQYLRTGYYPNKYTINYDAFNHKYDIVFRNFVYRIGTPIGIQIISTNIPNKFYAGQNYPNPFNPKTNIRFDIPSRSFVKITIFNSIGQEISQLLNEELDAGSYQAEWNANNYSSGIYFYRIQAGSFTETKKMMLIK